MKAVNLLFSFLSPIENQLSPQNSTGRGQQRYRLLTAIISFLILSLFGANSWANGSLIGAGFSATTGAVTNPYNLHSAQHNPAGLNYLIEKNATFRFGFILPNVTVQTEIGNTDGFKKTLDDIDVILKKQFNSQTDATAALATLNDQLLPQIENSGRFALGLNINPLLTPILWRSSGLGGTLSFAAGAELQLDARFKSAPAQINATTLKITSDLGFDSRFATLTYLSLGYGRTFLQPSPAPTAEPAAAPTVSQPAETSAAPTALQADAATTNSAAVEPATANAASDSAPNVAALVVQGTALTDKLPAAGTTDTTAASASTPAAGWRWGTIDGGVRVNAYNATLKRNYVFASADNLDESETFPSASSSAIGLDLGVMHTFSYFQWGLTGYNLNQPSFAYPSLANNTGAVAQAARGQIELESKAQLKAHWVLETSLFNASRSLAVQLSHALQPTTNLVGDERQYSTISIGVYPKFESRIANFFTPTLRAGIRKNTVGSQLTTTHFGFSLFRALNVDFWRSTEEANFDGNQTPRSLGASIGFASSF